MTYAIVWRIVAIVAVTMVLVAGGSLAYSVYDNYKAGQGAVFFTTALDATSEHARTFANGVILQVTNANNTWTAQLSTNVGGSAGSQLLSFGGSGVVKSVNGSTLPSAFSIVADRRGILSVLVGSTDVADCTGSSTLSFTVASTSVTHEC